MQRSVLVLLAMGLAFPLMPALAQAPAATDHVVPNFWDPAHRDEKPDLSDRPTIRFLAEAQSPPFSFIGADGRPTGFHVDIARAVCLELEIACTIQTLSWELLLDGLEDGRGDAIIASVAINEASRERFQFSRRFLSRPARFVARRDAEAFDPGPEGLSGKNVAVLRDTAHAAYLQAFFDTANLALYDSDRAARSALLAGEVDALFGDGLNLSLWLNGAASRACCEFRGGPYTESRFFGEGIAIAVGPADDVLRRAANYALARIHANGVYSEIFQRYFPISFY